MFVFSGGISISETDYICLKHDLLDVEEWIQGAIDGKIASCKGRLLNEWQTRLLEDVEVKMIPASEVELIDFIVARDDYKNRVQREVSEALSD